MLSLAANVNPFIEFGRSTAELLFIDVLPLMSGDAPLAGIIALQPGQLTTSLPADDFERRIRRIRLYLSPPVREHAV
jgi:hypothetical protein